VEVIKMKKRILFSLLIVALVVAATATGALALFTDQETSSASTFTTGEFDLALTDGDPLPFSVSGMAPGDVVYGGLQVSNSGDMELRYAMSTIADNTSILDEQLVLTIDVVTGNGTDGIWYTDDDVVGSADIYGPDGQLSIAAIGDPTSGAQAGDRILATSGNERLRFKVTLPLATDNSYKGTTCTVAFVFDAEQTVNNP
jgi:predicted ribosomally synthesized peptide with SipW-like signal peptide